MGNSCCSCTAPLSKSRAGDDSLPSPHQKGTKSDEPKRFTLVFERQGAEDLGIDVDVIDGVTLRVMEVHAGVVRSHNASASSKLMAGDHIVAVNGTRGVAARIVQRLAKDQTIEAEVIRPEEFSIRIQKQEGGIGIDIKHAPDGTSLLITSILGRGAIQEWNDSHEEKVVRKGDRIDQVNGTRGHWMALSDSIMTSDTLNIVISRCFPHLGEHPKSPAKKAAVDTVDLGAVDDVEPTIPEDTDAVGHATHACASALVHGTPAHGDAVVNDRSAGPVGNAVADSNAVIESKEDNPVIEFVEDDMPTNETTEKSEKG